MYHNIYEADWLKINISLRENNVCLENTSDI